MKAKFVYEQLGNIFKPKSKGEVGDLLRKYPIDYFNLEIRPNTEILLISFVEDDNGLYRLILGKDKEDEWCIWLFGLSADFRGEYADFGGEYAFPSSIPTWVNMKKEYLCDILADELFMAPKKFDKFKGMRGWNNTLKEIRKYYPQIIKEVQDLYKKDWEFHKL